MSRTLNLVDRLAEHGRALQKLGRTEAALDVLGRLARFRRLPAALAADTESRLGEMRLRRGEHEKACHHFDAAVRSDPTSSRYHHLFATALEVNEETDPNCALEHYRQSLALDPNQPRCLCDFGLLAVCLDQIEEGLAALRRAARLAPDDPEVISAVADGLREAGRGDEARKTLLAALFRNSRDARFRKLWNDFRFQQLLDQQEAQRHQSGKPLAECATRKVLPFIRVAEEPGKTLVGKTMVRRDASSAPPPPHRSQSGRTRKRKHAQ